MKILTEPFTIDGITRAIVALETTDQHVSRESLAQAIAHYLEVPQVEILKPPHIPDGRVYTVRIL